MSNVASSFPPTQNTQSVSDHQCTRAMQGLLRTISNTNILSGTFQDLVITLEKALFVTSCNNDASRCQFCPLSPEIISMAESVEAKYNSVMKGRVFLWSMRCLRAVKGEFTEELANDLHMLKQKLRTIVQEHELTSCPLNANMLDGARNLKIDGARFTNIAGNSTTDTSSNLVFVIKYNSGIGFWGAFVLLLLAFLVLRIF